MQTRDDALLEELGLQVQQVCPMGRRGNNAGTWLYDCHSGRYWWSDQVYTIFGLHRYVKPDKDLFLGLMLEEDRDLTIATFRAALRGKPYHFLHRIRVGKKIKWLAQRGRLHYSKNGAPYLLGSVRDVTAIKEKSLRVGCRSMEFSAITQYLAETTDTTDLASIVDHVNKTIRKRMDVVFITMFVRQNGQIVRLIPQNAEPKQVFLFQRNEDFLGYRVAMSGKQMVLPVSQYATELGRQALEEQGGRSVAALPIKYGGTTIGSLSIVVRRPEELSRQALEFCRTICGYLSNQLNNALLYDQLKQELERRTRLQSDLDVIFNESVDFITIIDTEGRFAQINPAFAARLGGTPQELVGQPVFDYIHPEDRIFAWTAFNNLPRTGLIRGFCNRFLCGGGEIGYLESNLKYMEQTGETIAIARDLTNLREMEARNDRLEQTVAFERTKSEFFAGLSHEFKTPLNIILSSLDLIRLKSSRENEERFRQEYARFFDYAYQNCYKLLRLTSNLLDAGQLENGIIGLHVTRVRLDELLRTIVDAAAVYAGDRGVQVDFQCEAEGPIWLNCDEDGVDRILLNLLSNAIKNSRENGNVYVTVWEEPNQVRICVDDNGAGIPADALPQIFDKFMTTRNPVSGQREGSGIGLCLVKFLTELHGGQVTAESRVGEGSRFTFTLSKNLAITDETERPAGGAVAALARLELADVK